MVALNRFRRKKTEEPARQPGDMTLVQHLQELRMRLIKCVVAVAFFAVFILVFFRRIFRFLSEPYCQLQEGDQKECVFLATDPLQPFNAQLTLAGYGGLILALPVILYQLGRFVTPALYPKEKRALLPFLVVSVALLFSGITLAYLFMPRALEVLIGLGGDQFEAFFTSSAYLGFFTKMLLAFGVAFQLPVILVFLQLVGLLQTKTLKDNRRIAVLAVTVLAAVITPTGDPFVLGVLAVPMYIFYEISIVIGGRMSKRSAALQ